MQTADRRTTSPRLSVLVSALGGPDLRGEAAAIADRLRGRERAYEAQTFLHDDDSRSARSLMITQGWAARLRWLPDGRRQFISILLPGDVLAQNPDERALSHLAVVALTPVLTVDMTTSLAHGAGAGLLSEGLERERRLEDDRLIDQIVRLGRQRALERVAHWVMEISERLGRVGLSDDGAVAMPLTQELRGDTLGLSIVHINRTVQELRRRGLIRLQAGRLAVLDRARLVELASYQLAPALERAD